MNLNLSDLSKEQKQYIVLGAMVAGGIIWGLFYGVQSILSATGQSKTELEDLNQKIQRADRELSRRTKTADDLYEMMTVLEDHLTNIPPEENYYSWATEIVYSKGRKAGLEIQSVDEVGVRDNTKISKPDPVYFETYSLRINASGSYAQTKSFLKDIEKSHPLVRFTGLEISKGRTPEQHDIQVLVQWPFKLKRIAALLETQTAKNRALLAQKAAKEVPQKPTPKAEAPLPEPVKPKPVIAKVPTPPVSRPESSVSTPPASVQPKPVPQVKPKEPAPVVVKQPVPQVKKPEPAAPAPVVATAPKPVEKPVVKKTVPVKPEPVVESPAPAVVSTPVVKPRVEPVAVKPIIPEPAPVVVKTPEPTPTPALVPEPKSEAPKPVVATKETPASEPNHVDSILASIDEIVAPKKQAETTPEPTPEPAQKPGAENTDIASLLASMDVAAEPVPESAPVPEDAVEPKDEMSTLLASLASRGVTDVPAEGSAQDNQDDLAAYVQELESKPVVESVVEPQVVEMVEPQLVGVSTKYESTGRSAKILEELLMTDKPQAGTSLGSFLDGLVEDINDKR